MTGDFLALTFSSSTFSSSTSSFVVVSSVVVVAVVPYFKKVNIKNFKKKLNNKSLWDTIIIKNKKKEIMR